MLKAAYLNELEKLVCRNKYVVFLVLDLVFCLLTAVIQLLAEIFSKGVISTFSLFDGMLLNGFTFYSMVFLPFILLMGCTDLFSGEYHDLSIRMVFQRPVARWKLFLAKNAAIFTVVLAYMAVHFVFLVVIKAVFGQTFAGTFYALAAYLIDILPLLVVLFFFAFIHQLVRSSGSAVALSVVAYLVIFFIGRYVSFASGLVFTEFIGWHSLWLGVMLPLPVLLPKIGIVLGTAIILYCAAYELFQRKEI